MSDFTPPDFWEPGTTQPSIPFNDNFLRWWISQTDVNNVTTAQPALTSPADDGSTYIIQSTHTGAVWSTFDPDDLVIWLSGLWYRFVPQEGNRISVGNDIYMFTSGAWAAVGGGGGGGDVVGPASSVADRVALFDGTSGKLLKDGGETIATLRSIPQNSQSTAYTLVLADAGKHILHPSADTTARTFTIPANGAVAFPVGTAVTIVNQNAAGVITIAITTDTMRLAGAGTTGSRTLAANGVATALKITSTEWIISGSGLS